jgi:DNA-binding XRE family transcriptional regulator
MQNEKRERLEQAGWKFGSTEDFLGLSAEEIAIVDMKLALAKSLQQQRQKYGLTQAELAKRLGSSQSRIAKMEAADSTVSFELIVRALLVLGTTRAEVGNIIGHEAAIL